jgi:hypothetical protein
MRTTTNPARALVLTAAVAFGLDAIAASSQAHAEHYSVCNPTPADQLRDMSTDRPDTTESPFTVDAGHFQVELSFVDVSRETRNDERRQGRAVELAPMLIKLGVLNNMDLQLGLVPHARTQLSDVATGAVSTFDGFGDLTFRAKINLWGNDGGVTALAIMPFVKFPTASRGLGNGKLEGGLILPFAVQLPHEFSLGFMPEFDVVRIDDGRYSVDWVHTGTLGFPIWGELGGYVEYAGFANLSRDERYRRSLNAGLTYSPTPNVQIDGGVRVGATPNGSSWGWFVGFSCRF